MEDQAIGTDDVQRGNVIALSASKQILLNRWLRGEPNLERSNRIRVRSSDVAVPISPEQEHVWLHAAVAPDVPLYNEAITIHRLGDCDPSLLTASLNEVIARHEILRTDFHFCDGQCVQRVNAKLTVSLPFTDLTSLPQGARAAAAFRIATEEARLAFDLGCAPLLRGRIMKLGEAEYRLHLALHHIIFDGVALYTVLLPTLAAIYANLEAGHSAGTAGPPVPEIQYGDYAVWRAEQLERDAAATAVAYWRSALAGELPVLRLPGDRSPVSEPSHRGEMEVFALPASIADRVRVASLAMRITSYSLLLASFQVLLFRYTGQTDIVVGGVADMRRDRMLEQLIGYFLNTLPIRTRPASEMPFRDYAQHTNQAVLEMLDARDVPFSHLVRALLPNRDFGMHPLFTVLFSVQPPAPRPPDGWDLTQMDVSLGTAKFDLYLELEERPEGLTGRFLYSVDRFEPATIRRMIGHWTTILKAVLDAPERLLGNLPLLTQAELAQEASWNDTARPMPAECLHELFEAQARRTPHATAVVAGGASMTYRALDARADQIAAGFHRAGVAPGDLVAVCLGRTSDLVAALLGILKAGAAYLPLDATQPQARLVACLDAAAPGFVLTDNAFATAVLQSAASLLSLDAIVANHADPRLDSKRDPASLAYVLCTSGTSGTPKAVEVPHRAVVNVLLAMRALMRFQPGDSILAITTVSFDIATLELFLPLVSGGRTIMADSETVADSRRLAAQISYTQPTVMQGTPSAWRGLVDAGWAGLAGLRVLVGGEALPRALADALLGRAAEVWNVYGPTETTIWSTAHQVQPGTRAVPIGQPIANTTAFVVDDRGHSLPVGVPGELCLGGTGVARGYRGRPDLTAQRFVFLAAASGERVYRTGDVVRRCADGALEWLGRNDEQLKIRGHRLEPAEVEAVLASLPGVNNCAVVARADATGALQLVAYVAGVDLDQAGLRREAARRLPAYMVPSQIQLCDTLPLNANGKINRRDLPGLAKPAVCESRPMNETECRLAGIWRTVLGLDDIDPTADFFALGGHSLLAMRLLAAVKAACGLLVTPPKFYQSPTVEAMAVLLKRHDDGLLAPGDPATAAPHSPAIQREALQLRRVRPALGHARGLVLGMPGMRGYAPGMGTIAANALQNYDVWTFDLDTGGSRLAEQGRWIDCASEIADRLLADQALRPRAFLGFSMAGTIGWLVDRFLVEAGREPTPVINFDGGVKHRTRAERPLQHRRAIGLPTGQDHSHMLLLNRGSPGRFILAPRSEAQWSAAGVQPELLPFRTLEHGDLLEPAAISAAAEALACFIQTGTASLATGASTFDFDTLGGELFRWLETPRRLDDDQIRKLMAQKGNANARPMQQALLLVIAATGSTDFALRYARRLSAEKPGYRAAVYAEVSVLAAAGHRNEAAKLALVWTRKNPSDPMLAPAQEQTACAGRVVLGSDAAMDLAMQIAQRFVQYHRRTLCIKRLWCKRRE